MAIKKIALNNIDKLVHDNNMDTCVHIDPATAVAYSESVAAAEAVEEIENALEKTADSVIPEAPEAPEVKTKSIYTNKLVLDEAIEDFSLIDGSKDDEDRYLEFDMFDFIYNLFSSEADSLIRPLKALSNANNGRGRRKAGDTGSSFMYQGSDDYIDDTGEKGIQGVGQISTDTNGNVVLYKDNIEDFNAVIDLCKEYGFVYSGPIPKKAPWLRWNYSLTVKVPTYADGYPMEVEDYFEQRGIAIETVMPPEFIRGRNKDYKKLNDEVVIDSIFDKYVIKAANSSDPLDRFLKMMFKDLDQEGVKYDHKALKDRFMAEFEDDFEDEE